MLKSFHHTGFVVRDLDTSAAFYSEVMGLEETTRMEVDGEFPERVVGLKGAHLKVALLNMGNGHISGAGPVLLAPKRRRRTEP